MPLYEYRCAPCGRVVEELRRLDRGEEPARCPSCGGPAVRSVSVFATPGLGRPRSRVVRDERMQSLLPYFAARD